MDQINLANNLSLARPLATLDLETTGLDSEQDRICQIACTIHYPDRDPIVWVSVIDPEVDIPKEVSDVHGITREKAKEGPTWAQVGPNLAPHLLSADIMGYNVSFDIGFVKSEMKRINVPFPWKNYVVDALMIYRKMLPHDLEHAYLEYGGPDGQPLPRGAALEGAHDAGIDVLATEYVLRGQLLRYHDKLPRTVKELSQYCFPPPKDAIDKNDESIPNWKPKFIWKGDVPCINFGKYAKNGPCPMNRVPKDYYQFMLDKNFTPSSKELARNALRGIYPKKDLLHEDPDQADEVL